MFQVLDPNFTSKTLEGLCASAEPCLGDENNINYPKFDIETMKEFKVDSDRTHFFWSDHDPEILICKLNELLADSNPLVSCEQWVLTAELIRKH